MPNKEGEMTLAEAVEYLQSIDKTFTVDALKKACDRGKLSFTMKKHPITHRVTTMEWLREWLDDDSVHRTGPKLGSKRGQR